ncbi:MAG: hypothetical protein K0R90_707, partial [Oscillospiraceae bacterium]|nr:hypothetical protein [Oscillospiraceae bacterium]
MTYKQTYEYIYRKLNGKYAHFTLEDKDEFTKE